MESKNECEQAKKIARLSDSSSLVYLFKKKKLAGQKFIWSDFKTTETPGRVFLFSLE